MKADARDHRARLRHRIVLLGHVAEVHQVVGRKVDAAHEGNRVVHHDELAMHPAKQVQLLAEHRRAEVEDAHAHAGGSEPA
jgi:hypothetical protein